MKGAHTYTNRRGEVYYLQSIPDKKGKPCFSFTRKLKGTGSPDLPEGCEAREDPVRAQVTLRKIQPSNILPLETERLDAIVQQVNPDLLYLIDATENALTIYRADINYKLYEDMFVGGLTEASRRRRVRLAEMQTADFDPVMRFLLTNAQRRLFSVDRWCFRGSKEGWMFLRADRPLEELARQYVPHLGKESFFDLMQ